MAARAAHTLSAQNVRVPRKTTTNYIKMATRHRSYVPAGIALAIGGVVFFSLRPIFIKLADAWVTDPVTLLALRMVFSVSFFVARRSEIIPSPVEQATEPACDHAHAQGAPARMSWARLLKLVFDIDIEHCPNCGGRLKIIAAIEDPPVIVRILTLGTLRASPTTASPEPSEATTGIFTKRTCA